jgi:CRISPR type I-E-associated protein CasB/Cse2
MDAAVTHILELRSSPAARVALRRGLVATTEHYAYPYLAPWWKTRPYLRRPLLTVAGLAATFPAVGQDDGVSVGALAASLVTSGALGEDGLERKLITVQSGPVTKLTPTLRTILQAAQSSGRSVDWADVYRMVQRWDHSVTASRTSCRRRLLEDYYQALSPATDPTQE